jgi:hypothetical protein
MEWWSGKQGVRGINANPMAGFCKQSDEPSDSAKAENILTGLVSHQLFEQEYSGVLH